jgi:hypothetical protein
VVVSVRSSTPTVAAASASSAQRRARTNNVAEVTLPGGQVIGLRTPAVAGGVQGVAAQPILAELRSSTQAPPLARLASDPVPAVTDGRNAVVFRDGRPGRVSVEVAATTDGVETSYVIADRRTSTANLTEQVQVPAGLTPRENGVGAIELVDAAGVVQAVWHGGRVATARAAHPLDPAHNSWVTLRLVSFTDGIATARLELDTAWFARRVAADYPVVIDPGISYPQFWLDTWVHSGQPTRNFNNDPNLWIGNLFGTLRSYLFFPWGDAGAGYPIASAKLELYTDGGGCTGTGMHVLRVADPWNSGTMTWNTQPRSSWDHHANAHICPTGWRSIDVTGIVRGWSNGSIPNYGVSLIGAWENADSLRMFASGERPYRRPILSVTYGQIAPVGVVDQVTSPGDRRVRVSGYAYDHDSADGRPAVRTRLFTDDFRTVIAGTDRYAAISAPWVGLDGKNWFTYTTDYTNVTPGFYQACIDAYSPETRLGAGVSRSGRCPRTGRPSGSPPPAPPSPSKDTPATPTRCSTAPTST